MPLIRAKYKFDRRIGQNLFGRPKSPVFKRAYKPGQHGLSKKKKKVTEFGEKVLEAKKVRLFYGGLRHKDIKRVVKEGIQKKGNSNDNIVQILESRLSSVVYRAKFAITPFAARQLINHGHVMVNGKKVDIPSYRLKSGDKISVATFLKENSHFVHSIKNTEREIPEYITVKGTEAVFHGATISNTHYPVSMNFTSLVEFFSR
jgi:small subunit ribosomal protein S4